MSDTPTFDETVEALKWSPAETRRPKWSLEDANHRIFQLIGKEGVGKRQEAKPKTTKGKGN